MNHSKFSDNIGSFIKFKSISNFTDDMVSKCSANMAISAALQNGNENILLSKYGDRRHIAPIYAFNEDINDINHAPMSIFNENIKYLFKPIHNIGFLAMKRGDDYRRGTAVIIGHSLNITYVLTAAHNILKVRNNHNKKQTYSANQYDQIAFIMLRNTNTGSETISKYVANSWAVHPKYFNKKSGADTRFDIGILKVFDHDNELRKIKPMKLRQYDTDIVHKKGKLIGFPWKYKDAITQALCGMSGDIEYSDDGNLIIYKQIDTSDGQSGAPIFACNVNEEKDDIFHEFEEIIGIHTTGDSDGNWGTFLDDDKLTWISNTVQCYTYIQSKYECDALLISSNSKYEKCLNKLSDTFNKSKTINVKKLYINNNKHIDKFSILHEIRKMLSDLRKTYIICYCGESDRNGNWIFNKYKPNVSITLNDILKSLRSWYRLCIISDCSYSGCWIQQLSEINYLSTKNGIHIQTSAGDEIADPGVFISKYAEGCLIWFSEKSKAKIARAITGTITAAVFGGIVAITYDYSTKNVYHLLTKKSTPMATIKTKFGFGNDLYIGKTNDGRYQSCLLFYNSWAQMDTDNTIHCSCAIGSIGVMGIE